MSEELKPCPNPWCDHRKPPRIGWDLYRRKVFCPACGMRGPESDLIESKPADPDAAQAALDAQVAAIWNRRADDWRDIESAPRDGTLFLAYEGGEVYGCQFYEEDEGGVEWASLCGQPVAYSPEPTHWKPLGPLPSPPEGE